MGDVGKKKNNLTSVLIKDWSPLAKQPLCLTNQFSIPITFDSISLSMTQFLFCDRYNYDCIFCEFTFLTVHRWLIKDMPMYKLSCFFLVFFFPSPCLRLSRLVLTTLPDPLAEFLCPKTYKTTDSVTTVSKPLTVPN